MWSVCWIKLKFLYLIVWPPKCLELLNVGGSYSAPQVRRTWRSPRIPRLLSASFLLSSKFECQYRKYYLRTRSVHMRINEYINAGQNKERRTISGRIVEPSEKSSMSEVRSTCALQWCIYRVLFIKPFELLSANIIRSLYCFRNRQSPNQWWQNTAPQWL